MRFNLAIITAAILTGAVSAIPVNPPNIGVDIKELTPDQVSFLDIKDEFEIFHWLATDEGAIVDREFTFELTEPAEFQITDFMKGGDVYELLDNDVSIGRTSELVPLAEDEILFAATPEEALEDSRFSKASYPLEAGAHRITITVVDPINESGTGAVRIVNKTPDALRKRSEKEYSNEKNQKNNAVDNKLADV